MRSNTRRFLTLGDASPTSASPLAYGRLSRPSDGEYPWPGGRDYPYLRPPAVPSVRGTLAGDRPPPPGATWRLPPAGPFSCTGRPAASERRHRWAAPWPRG